ncbi:MAG: hypothetical protein AB7O97_01095 [Planctomycetota bacterium]
MRQSREERRKIKLRNLLRRRRVRAIAFRRRLASGARTAALAGLPWTVGLLILAFPAVAFNEGWKGSISLAALFLVLMAVGRLMEWRHGELALKTILVVFVAVPLAVTIVVHIDWRAAFDPSSWRIWVALGSVTAFSALVLLIRDRLLARHAGRRRSGQ